MEMNFGDQIGPQSQSLDGQQQQLQAQQKLLIMTQELKILKEGGPQADALIQQKIAEGRPPPDLDQLLLLAQQAKAEGQTPARANNTQLNTLRR